MLHGVIGCHLNQIVPISRKDKIFIDAFGLTGENGGKSNEDAESQWAINDNISWIFPNSTFDLNDIDGLLQGHCEGAQCQMRSLWRRGSQHHCHDHCHHDCCQTLPETNSYKLSPSLRWSKHTKSSMNKTLTESSPRSSSFSPWRLLFSKFLKSSYYVYLLFYRTENPREN